MKIKIKNKYTQKVIFAHDQENNSIALTLKAAIGLEINLSEANLSEAYLSCADLRGANLRGANLSEADLSCANLSEAYLSEADLKGADLRGADLSEADLRGADLRGAIGNLKEIKSIVCDTWVISYTSEIMAIGCQQHSIADWFSFDDKKIASMHTEALKFWKKWKPILKLIIEG